jgi:endonuclease YncB( thermonuclease family)
VRLIGIDTPETKDPGRPVECGGKRATAAMLRLSFTQPQDTNADGLEDQEEATDVA